MRGSYLHLILLTLLGEISTHTEGPILFNPCLVMDIPSSLLRIQLPESRWAYLKSIISKAIAQGLQRNLQLGSLWGTQLKWSQLYVVNDCLKLAIKTLIVVIVRCSFALGNKCATIIRATLAVLFEIKCFEKLSLVAWIDAKNLDHRRDAVK